MAVDLTTAAERWRRTPPGLDRRSFGPGNTEHASVGETFVLTMKVPADWTPQGLTIIVYDARGRPRWSSASGLHLLGAGTDGVVAASYRSSNPLDPGTGQKVTGNDPSRRPNGGDGSRSGTW